jgi:hypothetical protein
VESATIVNRSALENMVHFFLLQLRAQCRFILNIQDQFDEEISHLFDDKKNQSNNTNCPNNNNGNNNDGIESSKNDDGESRSVVRSVARNDFEDISCCEVLMDRFFAGPALGDKWVPFSTACGDHERYIAKLYNMSHLTDKEKYLLHCAFRAGSFPPFFDEVMLPLFHPGVYHHAPPPPPPDEHSKDLGQEVEKNYNTGMSSSPFVDHDSLSQPYSDSHLCGLGHDILHTPKSVLHRNSFIHNKFINYRGQGVNKKKLHTSCYRNHPPKVSCPAS